MRESNKDMHTTLQLQAHTKFAMTIAWTWRDGDAHFKYRRLHARRGSDTLMTNIRTGQSRADLFK